MNPIKAQPKRQEPPLSPQQSLAKKGGIGTIGIIGTIALYKWQEIFSAIVAFKTYSTSYNLTKDSTHALFSWYNQRAPQNVIDIIPTTPSSDKITFILKLFGGANHSIGERCSNDIDIGSQTMDCQTAIHLISTHGWNETGLCKSLEEACKYVPALPECPGSESLQLQQSAVFVSQIVAATAVIATAIILLRRHLREKGIGHVGYGTLKDVYNYLKRNIK